MSYDIIKSIRVANDKVRRSAAAQRLAAERKAAGIKPGFMKNPGWKRRRAK